MFIAAYTTVLTLVDPGGGTQPPGTGGISTIISWAAWIALAVCVLGLIVCGGTMAIASRRGDGGEHATRLAMPLLGCIVVGAASGLIAALV